jgi:hypothetical protein
VIQETRENARSAAVLHDRLLFGDCHLVAADLGVLAPGWLAGEASNACWAWIVAVVQARLAFAGDARKCRLVAEADRRPARARSRITAVVAAARAAAIAMRVICQPGMPPAVLSWAVPPGAAGP